MGSGQTSVNSRIDENWSQIPGHSQNQHERVLFPFPRRLHHHHRTNEVNRGPTRLQITKSCQAQLSRLGRILKSQSHWSLRKTTHLMQKNQSQSQLSRYGHCSTHLKQTPRTYPLQKFSPHSTTFRQSRR